MSHAPDLADAIETWLYTTPTGYKYRVEWYVATKRASNEEFKKAYPGLNLTNLTIGSLDGWGWILKIYPDRLETFQQFPWGGPGSEEEPLMAADPEFFSKLQTILDKIEEYRRLEKKSRC